MDPQLYQEFARLEDRHWWFVGRKAVVRDVIRRHVTRQALRILDVGCGTGGMLPMLSELGSVEGLDASPEALALCRERVGPQVKLHQGVLPSGIPADRRYDLITAFDVIEHVDDAVPALRAMRWALSAGGTLVCTVPAYQFLWGEHDEVNRHRRRYTRGLLIEQLSDAGFKTVFSSYFNVSLLAPIAAVRLLQKVLRRGSRAIEQPRSDLEEVPRVVNGALTALFSAERLVVPRWPLPFGVSLVAVARPL